MNSSSDLSRPSMRGCPLSSQNAAQTDSGDGAPVALQVHDRRGRERPAAPASFDVRRDAFAGRAVHQGRGKGPARAVLEEQVDRLGRLHDRDRARALQRVRLPGGVVWPPRSPGPAAPTPAAGGRSSPCSARWPASPPSRARLPRPVSPARPHRPAGGRSRPPPASARTRRPSPGKSSVTRRPAAGAPESRVRSSSFFNTIVRTTQPPNLCLWWTRATRPRRCRPRAS